MNHARFRYCRRGTRDRTFIIAQRLPLALVATGDAGPCPHPLVPGYVCWVQPDPGGKSDDPTIQIEFAHPIKPETLTPANIQVIAQKETRNVTSAYDLHYDATARRLNMKAKNPRFNFGTGAAVEVTLSNRIEDTNRRPIGQPFTWTFCTTDIPVCTQTKR